MGVERFIIEMVSIWNVTLIVLFTGIIGSKFVGEFQFDHKDGRGIYYYPNGDRFETMVTNWILSL